MGVVGGIVVGALPGLGATMGIALLIPFTFGMEPAAAIIMLVALYTAGLYGGSITAILLHTPGTPASAATALDGYALTKNGKGLEAVGIATVASMVGGTLSGVALLFLAPPLATISLKFNAPEYFLIAIFGLTIIGSLAGDNMVKGIISGLLGMVVSFIGYDTIFGVARFTYGVTALESGIQLVPALIGLFSISQVLVQAEGIREMRKGARVEPIPDLSGSPIPSLKEFFSQIPNIIRSTVIGIAVGIMPGAGGDIGGWIGYNEAKRFSKKKELFGKGAKEGLYASESANNAVTGGSLVPLLTLGIPGSSASAVILGALMIHGLTPGYTLFSTQGDITYAILFGFMIANVLMGIIGLAIAKYVARVSGVSIGILAPIIVVLSIVGAYAINMSFADVVTMAVFGIVGYLMRKTGFATAPITLAIILGGMAERNFHRAIVMSKGSSVIEYYVSRPISLALIILIVVSLFAPLLMNKLNRRFSDGDSSATVSGSDD